MPKDSSVVADEVRSHARGLEVYLRKAERLHAAGHMTNRDVERAYSSAFLEFHAYVESSIERLFLGLLRGRMQAGSSVVRPLVFVRSDRVARDVVFGRRGFVDWLPYENTIRLARAFFASGLPFSGLQVADIGVLNDSVVIRNAIAHKSTAAMTKFEARFIQSRILPPRQRRPAGYLRGSHSAEQSRMSRMMASAAQVIRVLAD